MTENTPTPARLSVLEQVLTDHVPREVFFGYPVEPDEEDVRPDYQETCMCGDTFPCTSAQLAEQFQAKERACDALVAILAEALGIVTEALSEADDSELGWDAEVSASALHEVLSKLPADALAARDAERWDEGMSAGWSAGRASVYDPETTPDPINPYRIEREAGLS